MDTMDTVPAVFATVCCGTFMFCWEKGEGVLEKGGGSGTQNFVYQKWPHKIFPTVNSVFPTMVTWVWRRGGGGSRGGGGGTLLFQQGTAILILPGGGVCKVRSI